MPAEARRKRPGLANAALLALAASLLVNLVLKVWNRAEPLETDLFIYCMGGHTFPTGKVLYHDVMDQKPPVLHLIYAAGEILAGYGRGQIFLINVTFSSLMIIGTYLLGRAVCSPAWHTAVTLGLLSVGILPNIDFEVNQPNSELLINGLLVFMACIALARGTSLLSRVVYAFLALLVTMIKPHMVLPCLMLAGGHDFTCLARPFRLRRSLTLATIAAVATGWATLFGIYLLIGHFDDIWLSLVLHNATYVQPFLTTCWQSLTITNLLFVTGCLAGPLALSRVSRTPDDRGFVISTTLFACGCMIAVAAPGKWWPHYYQHLVIPVILSALGLLIAAERTTNRKISLAIQVFVAALTISASSLNIYRYMRYTPNEISRIKYKGDWFIETEAVAPIIKSLLKDDEWFFVWGQDPGLYVYTDIWPRTRFIAYFPFIVGNVQHIVYPMFFEDVARDPPDLVVFPKAQIPMIVPNIHDPILQWIATNYYPLPFTDRNQSHLLCVRTDSSLDMRTATRIPRTTLLRLLQSQ